MAFPGTYNFNYYRGDTFEFIINPKDSSGSAYPLTDFTGILTIADKRGTGATQYTGSVTVNTADNIVTCKITGAVGRNLTSDKTWVYDVQITDGVNIYTLLTGNITVTDDITGAV